MTVVKRIHKTKTVYLCGPIAGCTTEDMHGWRNRIKSHMALHYNNTELVGFGKVDSILHPLFHYLDPTDRVYTFEEEEDPNITKEIILNDKYYISQSDILVANMSMLKKYKCTGSTMEIIYAYGLGKYVLTIVDPEAPISPWTRYHTTTIVRSEQEAIDVLRKLA